MYAGSMSDSGRSRGARSAGTSKSSKVRHGKRDAYERDEYEAARHETPSRTPYAADWDEESGGAVSDRDADGRPSRRAPKGQPATTGGWCSCRPLTVLALCTVLFGPIGTVLTFLLLPASDAAPDAPGRAHAANGGAPSESDGGRGGGATSHMRVLHLSLAHTNVKARFVIDERSDWASFLAGCVERLKIDAVAKVRVCCRERHVHATTAATIRHTPHLSPLAQPAHPWTPLDTAAPHSHIATTQP
jgi:hypothetical protein